MLQAGSDYLLWRRSTVKTKVRVHYTSQLCCADDTATIGGIMSPRVAALMGTERIPAQKRTRRQIVDYQRDHWH